MRKKFRKTTNIMIKFMKIRMSWHKVGTKLAQSWHKVGTKGGKKVAQSWHLQ